MDPEEEIEKDKKVEIRKTVNILIKAINDKPSNKNVIKQLINSIKETFTQDIIIKINDELDKIKTKNTKNLECALNNLQLAYRSARKKKSSEEDSSGGKNKNSTKKRKHLKRRKTLQKKETIFLIKMK